MENSEILRAMKADHEIRKEKWRDVGCPGIFAEWLLENIERVLLQDRENSSR